MAADRSAELAAPVEVRITRGSRVESRHEVVIVVHERDASPEIIGSRDVGTFLRSVAKPFQTLALFLAGVPERFELTDEEIAVITASHAGEQLHHELVGALLHRHGFSADDLQCGIHPPYSASERRRRLRAGEPLSVLGNNCSGKHAGMLLHARLLDADPAGYLAADHPVQEAVRRLLEKFADLELGPAERAVDGCGVPTYFLSLVAIARVFQRLLDDTFLTKIGAREAAARLHRALAGNLGAFSGEGRIPSLIAPYLGGELFSKEGAEGVFVVWGKVGAAVIKVLDGHERGYRYLLPEVLARLGWISPGHHTEWRQHDPPLVLNVAGRPVGEIVIQFGGEGRWAS